LTTHREAATVTQALVATDLHLATDVLVDFTAKVSFDLQAGVDERTDLVDFLIGEFANTSVRIDLGGCTDVACSRVTDSGDLGEADFQALFARDINTGDTCHGSALPLLVTRVLTNDLHATMAADHLALLTDLLNAGTYFHFAGIPFA
jgi:hypothetical protein